MIERNAAATKLHECADVLRQRAAATDDHRIWRKCRDLADCLDAIARVSDHPMLDETLLVNNALHLHQALVEAA